jgi:hypothetical protein
MGILIIGLIAALAIDVIHVYTVYTATSKARVCTCTRRVHVSMCTYCCYHGSACTEHATLAAHLWTLEPFYGFSVTF